MKTAKIIILVFFTSLLFAGCSKDDSDVDETGKGTGTLTIKGIEYNMVEGIIYHNSGSVNYDIDLKSSPTNNGIGSETINLVALEMYTASSNGLQPGTYNCDASKTSYAGTFNGIIAMDIDYTEHFSYAYGIKSGTILVNRPDAGYEITIDVITDKYVFDPVEQDFILSESDIAITCYYIGNLKPSTH